MIYLDPSIIINIYKELTYISSPRVKKKLFRYFPKFLLQRKIKSIYGQHEKWRFIFSTHYFKAVLFSGETSTSQFYKKQL